MNGPDRPAVQPSVADVVRLRCLLLLGVCSVEDRLRGRDVLEQADNFGHEADEMARQRGRRWE